MDKKEEKTEEKKQEIKTVVVAELPKFETREIIGADGNKYSLITENEAMTEMILILRKLEKVWEK